MPLPRSPWPSYPHVHDLPLSATFGVLFAACCNRPCRHLHLCAWQCWGYAGSWGRCFPTPDQHAIHLNPPCRQTLPAARPSLPPDPPCCLSFNPADMYTRVPFYLAVLGMCKVMRRQHHLPPECFHLTALPLTCHLPCAIHLRRHVHPGTLLPGNAGDMRGNTTCPLIATGN